MATEAQDDKVRTEALKGAATGSGTATGQAREQASGKEDERLEGRDKRPAPEGGPEQGDYAPHEYAQPDGLQKEPAAFTSGGTIPASMVSSPSGFVPLSAVANPEEALERTLGAQGQTKDDRKLSDDELDQLDGPSIRAIGTQRGYQMPDLAGRGTIKSKFLVEQEKDERFKGKKK